MIATIVFILFAVMNFAFGWLNRESKWWIPAINFWASGWCAAFVFFRLVS